MLLLVVLTVVETYVTSCKYFNFVQANVHYYT